MAFEVILRDDVPHLGAIGEVVRVKPGYARNYLFPRGLAVEANRRNMRVLEHERRIIQAKAEREHKAAAEAGKTLDGLKLKILVKAGEGGKLYGSVTNLDIERALTAQGKTVERRRILLADPIKELGTYPIDIQVGRQVKATVQVTVEADGEPASE